MSSYRSVRSAIQVETVDGLSARVNDLRLQRASGRASEGGIRAAPSRDIPLSAAACRPRLRSESGTAQGGTPHAKVV